MLILFIFKYQQDSRSVQNNVYKTHLFFAARVCKSIEFSNNTHYSVFFFFTIEKSNTFSHHNNCVYNVIYKYTVHMAHRYKKSRQIFIFNRMLTESIAYTRKKKCRKSASINVKTKFKINRKIKRKMYVYNSRKEGSYTHNIYIRKPNRKYINIG